VTDRLRPLWDFEDLAASERRFRAQLEQEETDAGRAEVLTQLARVEGLRGDFDSSEELLREAGALADSSAAALIRIELERGRKLRSSGDAEAALPLFESAFARAVEADEHYLAGDAAHMAAIADPNGMLAWTTRGVDLAESEPDAAYWAGPLFNNLGWHHYEAGDYDAALDAFQRGLAAREREPGKEYEIQIARFTVGVALRSLGRPGEAAQQLERAVAWSARAGRPDAYFHEELAEDYAALERKDEAREQAELALALVDPHVEPERAARLQTLAAG
jgi:tetratricopeptide (TPR) repeat protein